MTYFRRGIMSLACLIAVTGCDQASSFKPAMAKADKDPITADIDLMQAEIRIAAANKRIDELERQVGELQATPEKLDLELLTRRVATLETMDDGVIAIPVTSSEKSTPSLDQAPRSLTKATKTPQDKQQQTSKSSMPNIEIKSRLATTSEAKEFNRTR